MTNEDFDKINSIQGFLVPGQERCLYDLALTTPENALILEIGSDYGRSTAALACACRGTKRRVWSVDMWVEPDGSLGSVDRFKQWSANMKRLDLDMYVQAWKSKSCEALAKFVGMGLVIDMAFVDGSHELEDARFDIAKCFSLLRPGGILAAHDVCPGWPGPMQAWSEVMPLLKDVRMCTTMGIGLKRNLVEAMMITCIVPWFKHDNPDRQRELNEALERNLNNPNIHRVIALVSHADAMSVCGHEKLEVSVVSERATFNDALAIANMQSGTIVLVNSDCYLDESLSLFNDKDLGRNVLCLSRWEPELKRHADLACQDCWIWQGPLNVNADFYFGQLGCDNHFAYLLDAAGYAVSNPCGRIRVTHIHKSGVRTYSEVNRLQRQYKFVPHTKLLPWEKP
jgi:predicted O-methyltransferase YrrM